MIHVPTQTRLFRSEAWFVFRDGNYVIALRISRLTSGQDLFINGRRVRSKQSSGQHTRHLFAIGGDRFELDLNIESHRLLTARLFKNGRLHSARTLAPRWILEKLKARTG